MIVRFSSFSMGARFLSLRVSYCFSRLLLHRHSTFIAFRRSVFQQLLTRCTFPAQTLTRDETDVCLVYLFAVERQREKKLQRKRNISRVYLGVTAVMKRPRKGEPILGKDLFLSSERNRGASSMRDGRDVDLLPQMSVWPLERLIDAGRCPRDGKAVVTRDGPVRSRYAARGN